MSQGWVIAVQANHHEIRATSRIGPEDPVLTYRLYFLGREGRITRAVELECSSDEDAMRAVEEHVDGRAMELWQQARKVRVYAAEATLAVAH